MATIDKAPKPVAASAVAVAILSAVNAAQISEKDGFIHIKDVPIGVSGGVMNGGAYFRREWAACAAAFSGCPAPAGHPKNAAGQYISATDGDALHASFVGAICLNGRLIGSGAESDADGSRVFVDIKIQRTQAAAIPAGIRMLALLDDAMAGRSSKPIHVSTGLFLEKEEASGTSLGKEYTWIARNIRPDHVAILLDEQGAATPEDGVGIFVNHSGAQSEMLICNLDQSPVDSRTKPGVLRMALNFLTGNSLGGLSFDKVHRGIYKALSDKLGSDRFTLLTVYDGSFIYYTYDENYNRDRDIAYRQEYKIDGGAVVLTGEATTGKIEEPRFVADKPQPNLPTVNRTGDKQVKDKIVAALNAAGISGLNALSDDDLLAAYAALQAKPLKAQLDAANAKLAEVQANADAAAAAAKAAEAAKRAELVGKITGNAALNPARLTAEELAALPQATLERMAAAAPAAGAGVIVGNAGHADASNYAANLPD